MRIACLSVLAAVVWFVGCLPPRRVPEPPFSYYHAPRFTWNGIARVLVLPFDNETAFPHVPDEARVALISELQQMGRFEIVPAPADTPIPMSRVVREHGRFNEALLVKMAREFRADLIVMGTVTQYSPYKLPRLGMVVQVISPADATVVASVDGLWDATCEAVAVRATAYYQKCGKQPKLRPRDEPYTAELVLESPRLFQRFVCFEIVHALVQPGPAAAPVPAVVPVTAPPLAAPPAPPPARMPAIEPEPEPLGQPRRVDPTQR